jgi:hypothetical protein
VDAVEKNDEADTLHFIARAAHFFPGHAPIGEHEPFDRELFRREYTRRAEKHWASRYAPKASAGPDPAGVRMAEAMEACAAEGRTRVMVYGAGKHTHRLGEALMSPPVEVVGIIDDNPALAGRSLWGFPIVSGASASGLRPDAIVVSSDTIEARLAEAAEAIAGPIGARVVRLYEDAGAAAGAGA